MLRRRLPMAFFGVGLNVARADAQADGKAEIANAPPVAATARSYFPETWLWNSASSGYTNRCP